LAFRPVEDVDPFPIETQTPLELGVYIFKEGRPRYFFTFGVEALCESLFRVFDEIPEFCGVRGGTLWGYSGFWGGGVDVRSDRLAKLYLENGAVDKIDHVVIFSNVDGENHSVVSVIER